jgi:hypothetical protein
MLSKQQITFIGGTSPGQTPNTRFRAVFRKAEQRFLLLFLEKEEYDGNNVSHELLPEGKSDQLFASVPYHGEANSLFLEAWVAHVVIGLVYHR